MVSSSQIERVIQQHLHDWRFSVDQLAECLNICPSHLRELVRKYYNLTPHNLIQKRRLELAVALLCTEKCIKTVSRTVGYINPRTFRNVFRRGFNMTPTEYVHRYVVGRQHRAAAQ